jgi:hypothetical protein
MIEFEQKIKGEDLIKHFGDNVRFACDEIFNEDWCLFHTIIAGDNTIFISEFEDEFLFTVFHLKERTYSGDATTKNELFHLIKLSCLLPNNDKGVQVSDTSKGDSSNADSSQKEPTDLSIPMNYLTQPEPENNDTIGNP